MCRSREPVEATVFSTAWQKSTPPVTRFCSQHLRLYASPPAPTGPFYFSLCFFRVDIFFTSASLLLQNLFVAFLRFLVHPRCFSFSGTYHPVMRQRLSRTFIGLLGNPLHIKRRGKRALVSTSWVVWKRHCLSLQCLCPLCLFHVFVEFLNFLDLPTTPVD